MAIQIKHSILGFLLAALVLTCTLCIIPQNAFANTPSGFSPKAIIPENQIDSGKTYFDLKMDPGQSQTLYLEVSNSEDQPILATVNLNDAKTGQDGVIHYPVSTDTATGDVLTMDDCASVETKTLRVEPHSSTTFTINVALPEKAFDGILLGGLVVSAEYVEETDTESQPSVGTMGIENRYEYVVGLVITESDANIKPALGFNSAEAQLINYRPYVIANISNTTPTIIGDMNVAMKVFNENSNELLREATIAHASMAPQTDGNFVVPWGNKALGPGTYRLEMNITKGEDEWSFNEIFTVSAQNADSINSGSVIYESSALPTWVYVALGALSAIILVFVALMVRNHRRRKRESAARPE